MGVMNLQNFRDELIFVLKNRTDTTDPLGFSTTRQDRYINAGYLYLCHPSVFRHREMQHSFTLTLVAGTQGYTFSPVGGVNIVGIRYAAHVQAATDDPTAFRSKLWPKDEQWFNERSHTSQSDPKDYFVRGNQLFISPIPGAGEAGQVIAVGAWREPALLSAVGDTTVLSSVWDEVLVLASRWRAEVHLGYRDLAEATKLDMVSLINEYADFERLHAEDWDWMAEVRTESYMERT